LNGTKEDKTKSKPRERMVKFCPVCGSTDIFFASGLPQLRSLWDCRRCGYRGAAILEDGKLAGKLGEEYARKRANKD